MIFRQLMSVPGRRERLGRPGSGSTPGVAGSR